jgi:hypothetical protein
MLLNYKSPRSTTSPKEMSYPMHVMTVSVSGAGREDSIIEAPHG